ncbi:DNA-directed RNA polymerase subunit beta [Bacillaceae bacterium S4-13-58]
MAANQKQLTREEHKKQAKDRKRSARQEKKAGKKPRIRLIPVWVKILLVVILCAVALAVGAMIGYGIIGDGNPKDVFQKETWQHIIDLVKK